MSATIHICVRDSARPDIWDRIEDVQSLTVPELLEHITKATDGAESWRLADYEGFGFDLPATIAVEDLHGLARWCDECDDPEIVRTACAMQVEAEGLSLTAESLHTLRRRFVGVYPRYGGFAYVAFGEETATLGAFGSQVAFDIIERELLPAGDVVLTIVEGRRCLFTSPEAQSPLACESAR